MERMFTLIMILWLAALDVAHAQVSSQVGSQVSPRASSQLDSQLSSQVSSQVNSQASPQVSPAPGTPVPPASVTPGAMQASPGGTGLTQTLCSTSGTSIIGAAPAQDCATDPLNVPSSNVTGPSAIAPAGAATGSTGGISPTASINPQIARQLPGEAANTATQAPATTASQPGPSSTTLCSPAIPATTGVSSPGSLFGAMSSSGC